MDVYEVDWVMQMLYMAYPFYAHNRLGELLNVLGDDFDLDPINFAEMGDIAVSEVFHDTKCYFHDYYGRPKENWRRKEFEERSVLVMRDPVLTEYDRMCREYERRMNITSVQNPYATALEEVVHRAMQLQGYAYDYCWYEGTQDKKGPRLVLMLLPEFESQYELPQELFRILDFCEERGQQLRQELERIGEHLHGFPAKEIPEEVQAA